MTEIKWLLEEMSMPFTNAKSPNTAELTVCATKVCCVRLSQTAKSFGLQRRNAVYFRASRRLRFRNRQNHPFIDGNKRTALVVMRTFLLLNGFNLKATQEEKIFDTFLK
jgi:death-on-curing family protein